jgi:hypothetical protein
MSKSQPIASRRLVRAGLAASAVTTAMVAATAVPAFAAAGTLSLSQPGGPIGGGNTIVANIATTPTTPNPTAFNASTAVLFVAPVGTSAAVCPPTYGTPGATLSVTGSPGLKVLSPSKIAVVIPTGLTTVNGRYMLCAYGGSASASTLIGGAPYTVGNKPTISLNNGVSPVSGPALGGTTITVTGTNFVANTATAPNNTTATIDGEPLTNINVAANGNSFTAVTPAHAPGGPYLLSVSTPGGTANTLGATTNKANLFKYSNGVTISPNTAPNTSPGTDVDVLGVGFATASFEATTGVTPSSANAHVYLTDGAYNATGTTGSGLTGNKTNGPITECISVLVISDTELLCSLPLNRSFDATGAVTAVAARTVSVATTATSRTITSATANFSAADVGLPIEGTDALTIPAGTFITAVASPTSATISADALLTAAALTGTTIGGPRTGLSGTATGTALTSLTGFTQADVGRVISSANAVYPAGTTITAVAANGTSATTSAAPGTNGAQTDLVVTQSTPVPVGTYTMTVVNNGAVGANVSAPADFLQSIVSSGSTFTVAEY